MYNLIRRIQKKLSSNEGFEATCYFILSFDGLAKILQQSGPDCCTRLLNQSYSTKLLNSAAQPSHIANLITHHYSQEILETTIFYFGIHHRVPYFFILNQTLFFMRVLHMLAEYMYEKRI